METILMKSKVVELSHIYSMPPEIEVVVILVPAALLTVTIPPMLL